MQTGMTLTQMAQQIETFRSQKKDFIADTRELAIVPRNGSVDIAIKNQGQFPIKTLAHHHIADRVQIPNKYYQRMLTGTGSDRELLANNVNHWFKANPEKRMIRTLAGEDRAFLSNRYQRIDHEHVAEVALPILMQIPDIKVLSCQLTDMRMYIQAVTPRLTAEVKRGDVVQGGIVISNSEVGGGAVSVAAMDYRLVCLNGAISTDKFRAFHTGRAVDDSETLWADDTRKADDRVVLLKVRDMVKAAVDATRFQARIERAKALTGEKVRGNPVEAVEVLSNQLGLNETESGNVLRTLIEGGDLSAWGVLNAVTAQAHTADNYDRAVEFEAMGGQLLNLSRKEWTRVLEAA